MQDSFGGSCCYMVCLSGLCSCNWVIGAEQLNLLEMPCIGGLCGIEAKIRLWSDVYDREIVGMDFYGRQMLKVKIFREKLGCVIYIYYGFIKFSDQKTPTSRNAVTV